MNRLFRRKTKELAAPKDTRLYFFEAGTSGLKEASGFVNEAYNQSLFWPQCYPLYSRIRRSMPEIVMIRQAFTSWARSVGFVVDLPEDATDDDKKYQEFIYSVLADMEGGETGFKDTLVNHVPFWGWGWWEVVPGKRIEGWVPPGGDRWRSDYDDGLIGLRRLGWRDPGSFSKWDLDDHKHLLGMVQQDFPNPPVELPIENSLHMTYGDPNNPEGLSPLEAVWRLERIKFGLEVVQGIGFEHAAGYLDIKKTVEGVLSDNDKSNIRDAAKYILSAQEGNYASWPYGIEGEVKDIPFSAAPSLLDAIKHYSMLALSVYTMQWMALNTISDTGSLAMAKDSSSIGVMTFNAMMDGFADQFDNQVGKRLYNWNKDAFPNLTERPIIRFEHIDKDLALSEMGDFLNKVAAFLPLGDDDLLAIRQRTGFLPEILPEVEELPEPEPNPFEDVPPEEGTPPEDETPPEEPTPPEEEMSTFNPLGDLQESEWVNSEEYSRMEKTLRDAIIALEESEPTKEPEKVEQYPRTFNINVPQPEVNITNQMPELKQADVNITNELGDVILPKQDPTIVNITNDMPELHAPDVTVNVPEQNVTVNVPTQEPPVVNLTNEVHPADVQIQNIPAPEVTIENKVDVNPTPVNITNDIKPAELKFVQGDTPIVNVTIEDKEPAETEEVIEAIKELSKRGRKRSKPE